MGIEAEAIKDDVERRRQLGEMQGRSELFHTLRLIICCPAAKAEFILIMIMIGGIVHLLLRGIRYFLPVVFLNPTRAHTPRYVSHLNLPSIFVAA